MMKIKLACLALAMAACHATAAASQERSPPARTAAARYTTAATPIGTLLDDPAARTIVDRHLPNTSTDRRIYFARKFTLKAIQPMSRGKITDRQLAAIDADLAWLRRR